MAINWANMGDITLLGKTLVGNIGGSRVNISPALFGDRGEYKVYMPDNKLILTLTFEELEHLRDLIGNSDNYALMSLLKTIISITDNNIKQEV